MRSRSWIGEEQEQGWRPASMMNLGRNLKLGYDGPWWTPEEMALLERMTDGEVAALTDRTETAVRGKRLRVWRSR